MMAMSSLRAARALAVAASSRFPPALVVRQTYIRSFSSWDPNESLSKASTAPPRAPPSLDALNPVEELDQVKINRYTSAASAEHMNPTSIHTISELQFELATLLRSPSTPKSKLLELSKTIIANTAELFPQSDPHPALARAYNDDGYVNKRLGLYVAAIESYHTAVALYRDSIGKDNASFCSVMNNLSICYKEMGDAEPPSPPTASAKEGGGTKLGYLARAREAGEECLAIRVDLLRRAVAILGGVAPSLSPTMPDLEGAAGPAPGRTSVDETIKRMKLDVIQSKSVLAGVLLSQSLAMLDNTQYATIASKGLSGGPFVRSESLGGKVFRNVLTKSEELSRMAVEEACSFSTGSLLHANTMNSLALLLKIKGNMAATEEEAEAAYGEARFMYDNALEIRDDKHKSMIHEDVLATKFSIAELLESMGDSETAKEIKQHVLDSIEGTEIDAGKPMPGKRQQTNDDMVKNLFAEHNAKVLERMEKEKRNE